MTRQAQDVAANGSRRNCQVLRFAQTRERRDEAGAQHSGRLREAKGGRARARPVPIVVEPGTGGGGS
jgi:hypothetical protein